MASSLEPDMIDSKGQPGPLHPLNKNFLKNLRPEDIEWGLEEIKKQHKMDKKAKVWPERENWAGDPQDGWA